MSTPYTERATTIEEEKKEKEKEKCKGSSKQGIFAGWFKSKGNDKDKEKEREKIAKMQQLKI